MTFWNPPQHLVREAIQGDPTALCLILERTRPEILKLAGARTADPDEAEDVAQEVLIRILRGIGRYRGDGMFSSWVYRIVQNELETVRRKRRAILHFTENWEALIEAPSTQVPGGSSADFERFKSVLGGLIESLPPAQRRALELVDLEGFGPAEAARILGKTPVTLRAGLCRGRRKIRDELLRAQGTFVMEMLEGAVILQNP